MPNFNCECDEGFYGSETLAELRFDVMVRLGYAAQANNPPPGMATLIDSFLNRAQKTLYRRYKALHTERFYRWTMTPGERFYGVRDNIDDCLKKLEPGRITWVGVEDLNGAWNELRAGIPPHFYTAVDFDGLPSHFEVRQCIEVFPAPDVAYTLRVKGHFGLMRFTEDTDRCTIDSDLVFLWALANAKNHYGQPDASDIAAQAQTLLKDLVSETHARKRYVPGHISTPAPTRPLFTDLEA